nr:reverse transcriptase domain-containing protein [Tanacetum cinerariifolium]
KSTSGRAQLLGEKLVSWSSKIQDCTSMSTAEAEYVSLSACCAQVLRMQTQLMDYGFSFNKIPIYCDSKLAIAISCNPVTDYGFHFNKIPIYCDSKSVIAISCNPVQHSRTKHIDVHYHFIKEHIEKGTIELYFVKTDYELADIFTKALSTDRFNYLVRRLGMRSLSPKELKRLTKSQGRLLASFQDHEHEGDDTRSQGGIKDNDLKIKIQDHNMQMINQKNSQEQGSKIQESDGNDKVITRKTNPQLQLNLLLLLKLKELSQIMLLAVALTRTKIVMLQAEMFIETTSKRTLPSNTITNPKEYLKGITTQSSVSYKGPTIPTQSKVMKQGTEVTKDQVQTLNSQSTAPVQPPVIQPETQNPVFEPVVAPVSVQMPNLKPSIPYPWRRDNERRRDQANEQIEKSYEIFKEISFEISFMDDLILMPKFASTLKALIRNKEKPSEMARTPMNEHCSVVIVNKLPRKLRDPSKFLITCEFPGMDECLALADLGVSINLMPLSVWEGLSLLELTPTCMTLELADRSVSKPIGIAKMSQLKLVCSISQPTLWS